MSATAITIRSSPYSSGLWRGCGLRAQAGHERTGSLQQPRIVPRGIYREERAGGKEENHVEPALPEPERASGEKQHRRHPGNARTNLAANLDFKLILDCARPTIDEEAVLNNVSSANSQRFGFQTETICRGRNARPSRRRQRMRQRDPRIRAIRRSPCRRRQARPRRIQLSAQRRLLQIA